MISESCHFLVQYFHLPFFFLLLLDCTNDEQKCVIHEDCSGNKDDLCISADEIMVRKNVVGTNSGK